MVLGRAIEIAPKVIVIIMPEHSKIRKGFGGYADHQQFSVLQEFESEAFSVIDFSDSINDRFMRDIAHLTFEGRVKLTYEVAAYLNSMRD